MLAAVFCFNLPEISISPIFLDMMHSFKVGGSRVVGLSSDLRFIIDFMLPVFFFLLSYCPVCP